MPLESGINSFNIRTNYEISRECLIDFYVNRHVVLTTLQEHAKLINQPYNYKGDYLNNKIILPGDIPNDHPLYLCAKKAGLDQFGSQLAKTTGWSKLADKLPSWSENDKMAYAEPYAIIDMCLYLVFMLNTYTPNERLIKNFLSVHSKIDALGRENLNEARSAINRLVEKFNRSKFDRQFGEPIISFTENLILFAKLDEIQSLKTSAIVKGVDFERACCKALEEDGFEVKTTPSTGDYGADLIAQKDGLGFAIQCKDTLKTVGVKAVQEAVAARSHYKSDFAVVCAVAGFTEPAIQLASSRAGCG